EIRCRARRVRAGGARVSTACEDSPTLVTGLHARQISASGDESAVPRIGQKCCIEPTRVHACDAANGTLTPSSSFGAGNGSTPAAAVTQVRPRCPSRPVRRALSPAPSRRVYRRSDCINAEERCVDHTLLTLTQSGSPRESTCGGSSTTDADYAFTDRLTVPMFDTTPKTSVTVRV